MRNISGSVKTLVFSITCVVWLSAVTCPLTAQTTDVLRDYELYDNARKAREQKPPNYYAAMVYIYAYIQRNNADMQQDIEHRKIVLEFYETIKGIVSPPPGSRGPLSVPPALPARMAPPASEAQPGYPLVCRGGGSLYFTYTPYSNILNKPQFWIRFDRGTTGVGMNRENLGSLAPGQCAWLDRAVSPQEPDMVVIADPVFKGSSFSISWQRGQVMGIGSELHYINALQHDDGIQTFHAYNDRKGHFIVTKIE